MARPTAPDLRSTLRAALVLATRHLQASAAPWPAWGDADVSAIRAATVRLLTRQAECARAVGPAAAHLVSGIALVPYLGAAGGLGGFLPPLIMGVVYQATGSYAIGLMLLSNVAFAGAVYTAWRLGPGATPAPGIP